MSFEPQARPTRIGIGIAALLVAVAALVGCGESDRSTSAGRQSTAELEPINPAYVSKETGRAALIRNYLKKSYGDKGWYPKVTDIEIASGQGLISTYLKWYPRKIRRNAHEICDAVLASKVVDEVAVFWGANEVTHCSRGE